MTDRFKFRAWFNGRFIYKSLCDSNVYTEDDKCICIANNLPDLPWKQCTGLKDKNGKLIYEGDIVLKSDGDIYEVFWDEKMLGFYLQDKIVETVLYKGDVEVIGNIHENADLLENEE